MRRGQTIQNKEVTFSDKQELVSTTDTRGVITYANEVFCDIAGYTNDELMGKSHNILRHPDMPKAAFKDMWDHLKKGESWHGIVKNLCKDGRYYWVDAFVTPIYEGKQLVGYQSVRVKPKPEQVSRAIVFYDALNKGRKASILELSYKQKALVFVMAMAVGAVFSSYVTGDWFAGVSILLLGVIGLVTFKTELIEIPNLAHQ